MGSSDERRSEHVEQPPSVLRDPPAHAVRDGRLDPDLPICICGEQVAVAHKDCQALFNDSWYIRKADDSGRRPSDGE
jgi:hypothetical protein